MSVKRRRVKTSWNHQHELETMRTHWNPCEFLVPPTFMMGCPAEEASTLIMDLNIYFAKESGKLKEDPGKDDTVAGLAAIPLP